MTVTTDSAASHAGSAAFFRRWTLVAILVAPVLLLSVFSGSAPQVHAALATCTVERVIDGDTFVCTDGKHIRMLQINAQELSDCGGQWAKAALSNIFLRPGTEVRLDYDAVRTDRYGRDLAAPIVLGSDGAEYNISIVMVYTGLAKAAYYGDNAKYLDWADAAQTWAAAAQWNMWAPGGPYNGATYCGA
jgi:endonuclease YncB( thermonuclease family)